ncbi:MAG: hypothetical protein LGB57_06895, partial [Sulfurovum sp.]|nr:hypothetical protein [Sulfurovum sp.]
FVSLRCGSVWRHPDDEDKTGSDMSFLWGIHYLYVLYVGGGGDQFGAMLTMKMKLWFWHESFVGYYLYVVFVSQRDGSV